MLIKVYYAAPSVYGRKVLSVLEEKGLDYEIEKMSFKTQDHLKEEYLKINPNGEIPALDDNGFIVYESTAIIEYLEDEYPEPRLMPEDSEGRARVRMIEDYCDLHVYPLIQKIFVDKVLHQKDPEEETVKKLKEGFTRLAAYLGSQQYISGEFSLADCAVMPAVASAEALGLAEDVIDSQAFKKYAQKLKQHAGYKGANLMTLEASTAS